MNDMNGHDVEDLRATGLMRVHLTGRLQFFGEHATLADARAFKAWLAPLRQREWVVYAKRPFAGPQAVLAYLSRYTHRVAISNSRLIAMDEHGVTVQVDGLPDQEWRQGQDAPQGDDAGACGVHAALLAARAAGWLESVLTQNGHSTRARSIAYVSAQASRKRSGNDRGTRPPSALSDRVHPFQSYCGS
jgi:Putative transposase